MTQSHHIINPGYFGAAVSIGSLLYSFVCSSLPVMQWCAALLGGTAATISIIWTIKQMRRGKR